MKRLYIVGAGPHGGVALAILRAQGLEPDGFLDDAPQRIGTEAYGLKVVGSSEHAEKAGPAGSAFVAIGSNGARHDLACRLRSSGVNLVNAIHPAALVMEGVRLGTDIFLGPNAVVMVGTVVEDDVVINTAASVDHDSSLRAGAYLSPGVRTAGRVDVGSCAFVGIGASIGPGVSIGRDAVVGAGSVVLADVPASVYVAGVPARVVRRIDGPLDWHRLLGGSGRALAVDAQS